RTTLRPLGPNVVLTALARMFTPRTMRTRASSPNRTCLAAIVDFLAYSFKLQDHREDFVLADDEQLFAVDLDRLAGVFAKQNFVASFQVNWKNLAVFGFFTGTNSNDFALIGLFSGALRDNDTRGSSALVVQTFDDHAIVQRTQCHEGTPVLVY